jgi:hypothetical protein
MRSTRDYGTWPIRAIEMRQYLQPKSFTVLPIGAENPRRASSSGKEN